MYRSYFVYSLMDIWVVFYNLAIVYKAARNIGVHLFLVLVFNSFEYIPKSRSYGNYIFNFGKPVKLSSVIHCSMEES